MSVIDSFFNTLKESPFKKLKYYLDGYFYAIVENIM